MAIKGKKKSQTRGSQARRRPATAPRVVTSRHTHTPWYQTSGGRVIAALIVVLMLTGVGIVVAQVNASGNREEKRREALDAYTREIRSVGQSISGAALEMQQLTAQPPREKDMAGLEEQAEDWVGTFTGARPEPDLRAPSGLSSLSPLFARSVDAYSSAATTYGLAAKAATEDRAGLFTLAAQQQSIAVGVWVSAVGVLDEARAAQDMDPSGLDTPGAAPGGG
jgi:hypothetical protein